MVALVWAVGRCSYVPHAKELVCSEISVLFLDILSGTIIKKPKLSSWETSNLSSDISLKPRKIFNSGENEEEFQPGEVELTIHVKYLNAFSISVLMEEITFIWKPEEYL